MKIWTALIRINNFFLNFFIAINVLIVANKYIYIILLFTHLSTLLLFVECVCVCVRITSVDDEFIIAIHFIFFSKVSRYLFEIYIVNILYYSHINNFKIRFSSLYSIDKLFFFNSFPELILYLCISLFFIILLLIFFLFVVVWLYFRHK